MLIEGALILLGGFLVGRFAPAGRRKPKPPKPVKPICSCGHGMHDHDPKASTCHAQVPTHRWVYGSGNVLDGYRQCTCQQYTGPSIYPEFIAREIAG